MSYDELYERADSFEELYATIADDLVALALSRGDHEVLYVVPGSPVVAERTVELLRLRDDVTTVIEPAVSIIDVACAVLGTRSDDRRTTRRRCAGLDTIVCVDPVRSSSFRRTHPKCSRAWLIACPGAAG